MVLHYYLADDTVEIRENCPANAGRDAAPTFLRRCRLPKTVEPLRRPGELADRTVLNVFGPMGKGGRYILDSLKVCIADYSLLDAFVSSHTGSFLHHADPPLSPLGSDLLKSFLKSALIPSAIVLLYDNLNHYQLT